MIFEVKPIGVIRTPFKMTDKIPIQASRSSATGEVEVFPEYSEGLDSLDGFSHVFLMYWFHKAQSPRMKVTPFLDTQERGLFSTRAPSRPNPVGFSVVKILTMEGNTLKFKGADMLNDTPLIDIKPFVPRFDNRLEATSGWLDESSSARNHDHRSDDRFIDSD